MIYLVIWKTTVWESQEPLWCEKQNRRKCYSHRMRVCPPNQHLCIAKFVLPPQPYSCIRISSRWGVFPIGNASCPPSACSEWCPYAPKYLYGYSSSFVDSLAAGLSFQIKRKRDLHVDTYFSIPIPWIGAYSLLNLYHAKGSTIQCPLYLKYEYIVFSIKVHMAMLFMAVVSSAVQ